MNQAEMTGTQKPQRKFKRVPQHIAVNLHTSDGSPGGSMGPLVRAVATDLGPGGMQLLMGTAHQIGTYLSIEVTLDGKAYNMGGVVRHLRWVSATPGMMFSHGVEIVDVSESTMRSLVNYLAASIARRPLSSLPKTA